MSHIWDFPAVKLAIFHRAAREAIRAFPAALKEMWDEEQQIDHRA